MRNPGNDDLEALARAAYPNYDRDCEDLARRYVTIVRQTLGGCASTRRLISMLGVGPADLARFYFLVNENSAVHPDYLAAEAINWDGRQPAMEALPLIASAVKGLFHRQADRLQRG